MLLIADHGIYIVENANLEELGAAGAHLFGGVRPFTSASRGLPGAVASSK